MARSYLAGACAVAGLTALAGAPALPPRGLAFPAAGTAPAFTADLAAREGKVRLTLHLPQAFDPSGWVLRVWVADPARVAERVRSLRAFKENQDRPAPAGCLAAVRDDDPFFQCQLPFGTALARAGETWEGELTLDGAMDFMLDSPRQELDLVLQLRPEAPFRPEPVRRPLRVALDAPLPLTLTPDQTLAALALRNQAILAHPQAGAYVFQARTQTGVDGDIGAMGTAYFPGPWRTLVPDSAPAQAADMPLALFLDTSRKGLHVAYAAGVLALRTPTATRRLPVPTMPVRSGADPASLAPTAFQLVDAQETPRGWVVVVHAQWESRPTAHASSCGAGLEAVLAWFLLDPDLAVKAQQKQVVESCLQSIESLDTPSTREGWEGEVAIGGEKGSRRITYRSSAPERGLQARKVPSAP